MAEIMKLKMKVEKLNIEIENLKKFVNGCPEGKLISRKKSCGYNYYLRKRAANGKYKDQYLNRGQRPIVEALAKKEYALACIKDKEKEKRYLEKIILHEERESATACLLQNKPGLAELIIPTLKDYDDYVTEWIKANYIRSDFHPEHLTIPTVVPDLIVRSKSESLITSSFVKKGVPFRYEEVHQFGDITLCPDFTCLNPRTHEIFYLEHYGSVDKPSYIADQRWREDQYFKVGIYLWKNLLITTETESRPLDVRWLEEIIDYYLL